MPEILLSRRSCLTAAASLAVPSAGWLLPHTAWAGGQLEEPLADSVRTALSAAVAGSGAPPELEFTSTEARMSYLRWLVACSDKLASASLILRPGASSCRPSGMSPSARALMCPWSWA